MTRPWINRAFYAVVLVFLFALPFLIDKTWVEIVTLWIPLAIAAAGLNLLTGYNGQVSIGHGALFGLGAYAAALTVNAFDGDNFLLGILVGGGVAFVVGIVIGLPALRIRGLYLAMVTLMVAVLFPSVLDQFGSVTESPGNLRISTPAIIRGVEGNRLVQFRSPFEPNIIADDQWRYLYVLTIAVVCFVLVRNLVNSRIGRAIVAVRDNEIAAETNGVNVAFVKVVTFGISAGLAGVGGALFALAQEQPQLNKGSFTLALSLVLIVAVVLGGPATIIGPAIGAAAIGFFDDVVRKRWLPEEWAPLSPIILAVLLILSVLLAPGGTAGSVKEIFQKRAARNAARAETGTAVGTPSSSH